ncbi:MAG TPA: bifunctional hydroxymethylpyrimidine kinase/phosphomethylpyrimidine kinase [Roseiarcus sp.]|jgi:hydroxymethylpyrimidine/phosphomethylpyrimidine kinase
MGGGDAASVTPRLPIALTIAGSDSGGGAGIQADLKTFAALGVYGASAITAITVQNTQGVRAIHYPPPGIVGAQIEAVLEDFPIGAIKIGMLGMAAIVEAVAESLLSPTRRGVRAFIIYDPVMIASSGDALSGASFVETVRASLLPLVNCLTPNLAEAAALLGEPIARSEGDVARQGEALLKLGPRAVLMKGGHLESEEVIDLLVTEGGAHRFAAPRLASQNLHGTGCTLSSAIAANIVLRMTLPEAVGAAKAFVSQAIERGREVALGSGAGPLIQTELYSKL